MVVVLFRLKKSLHELLVLRKNLQSAQEILVLELPSPDVVRIDSVEEHEDFPGQPLSGSLEMNSVLVRVLGANKVVVQTFVKGREVRVDEVCLLRLEESQELLVANCVDSQAADEGLGAGDFGNQVGSVLCDVVELLLNLNRVLLNDVDLEFDRVLVCIDQLSSGRLKVLDCDLKCRLVVPIERAPFRTKQVNLIS